MSVLCEMLVCSCNIRPLNCYLSTCMLLADPLERHFRPYMTSDVSVLSIFLKLR